MLMITRRDMMKGTAALVGGSVLPWTLERRHRAAQGSPAEQESVWKDDLALINGKFVDGRGEIDDGLDHQERPHHEHRFREAT